MARPTLATGDVWSEALANSSGFPILDGSDEFGHGPQVVDDWLSDNPAYIKSQFYGWQNRVRVSASALNVQWSGAPVMLGQGEIVAVAAGSMAIDPNTVGFIFISTTGTVAKAAALAPTCVPLAYYQAGATSVALTDLRTQAIEQVRPMIAPVVESFDIGDIKWAAYAAVPDGWLNCDGAAISRTQYAQLYAKIGHAFDFSGIAAGLFRIPNLSQRSPIGDHPQTPIGQYGGAGTVALSPAQMPAHSHGISDPGHSHGISDPGHAHGINDPGHAHSMAPYRPYSEGKGSRGFGAELTAIPRAGIAAVNTAASGTGIGVFASATGVSAQAAATGLSVASAGAGAAFALYHPYATLRAFIRAN